MVVKIKWKCEDCGELYSSRGDALHCECYVNNRYPEEIRTLIECDMCGKDCANINEKEICEENHKKWNDHFYDLYLIKLSHEALAEAANDPSQSKLEGLR